MQAAQPNAPVPANKPPKAGSAGNGIKSFFKEVGQLFVPNAAVSRKTMGIMIAFQVTTFLLMWIYLTPPIIPKPLEILSHLKYLITSQYLLDEIFSTTGLCLKAMCIATVFGYILSYSIVLAWFRPFVLFIVQKFRFLTVVGFGFIFMMYTRSANQYKVALLVFGILPYFVAALSNEVGGVEEQKYDWAKTMRMGPWESLYYIPIRTLRHKVLEIFRQNFAIAWMLITMVESANRQGGGLGALLVDKNRYATGSSPYADTFAIQLVIFAIGITVDFIVGGISRKAFKWAYNLRNVESKKITSPLKTANVTK